MRGLSSSVLLGAAASLALTSGAQAADLPMKVKAPAVQYVKICSLYGAGYYYIPGTDTCLKIGGFVRVDMIIGPTGGAFESYNFNAELEPRRRIFTVRARAYVTFDARTQTEYGTLRSYFLIGETANNSGGARSVYMAPGLHSARRVHLGSRPPRSSTPTMRRRIHLNYVAGDQRLDRRHRHLAVALYRAVRQRHVRGRAIEDPSGGAGRSRLGLHAGDPAGPISWPASGRARAGAG